MHNLSILIKFLIFRVDIKIFLLNDSKKYISKIKKRIRKRKPFAIELAAEFFFYHYKYIVTLERKKKEKKVA